MHNLASGFQMDQPTLGKQIVELRKAKGLTQTELVEKCNLSVRTLQRIESGEVTPRSYTLRIILAALDYNLTDQFGMAQSKFRKTEFIVSRWLEQFYRYAIDLFNLKTNTMKKISILSAVALTVCFVLVMVFQESTAQSAVKVKKTIDATNKNFVHWFNTGKIDSLAMLYLDNACLVGRGCGKTFIQNYYKSESEKYKFKELITTNLQVTDSITTEIGKWAIHFPSGEVLSGEYLTEWRLVKNNWLIQKDQPYRKEN